MEQNKIEIISVSNCLSKNLSIPEYQRPYKWGVQNITDLLLDIEHAISENRLYIYLCTSYLQGNAIFPNNRTVVAGSDFFEMVDHYLQLMRNMESELRKKDDFAEMRHFLEEKHCSIGMKHVRKLDVPTDGQYYIGSLIVYRRNDAFEVIDGQQRLTTLFLLLKYLGEIHHREKAALQFDCRDKSNYTLNCIDKMALGTSSDQIDERRIQQEIISGYNIIKDKLECLDDTSILMEKLRKTVLYRIEVPNHTDLNHYFEIMNTRGEQLEQSDVLKAKLMA